MVSTRQMTTTTSAGSSSSSSSSGSSGGSTVSTSSASSSSSSSTPTDSDISPQQSQLSPAQPPHQLPAMSAATDRSAAASGSPSVVSPVLAAAVVDVVAPFQSAVLSAVSHSSGGSASLQRVCAPAAVAYQAVSSASSSSGGRTLASKSSTAMQTYRAGGGAGRQRPLTGPQRPANLLDLPLEMLDEIFSYVGYHKVSQIRVVSKSMNAVCSAILNSTFAKLTTYLMNRFRLIKNNMPRRESSRRMHPLSYECDIIETCYMRVSLLQMTFGKHMDRKHICFFAGAILDELYAILHGMSTNPLFKPHSMTEELYDLSTMAMEYFKEHLEPRLPPLMPVMRFSSFVDHSKNNTKTKYLLDTTTGHSGGAHSDTDAATLAAAADDDDEDMVAPAPPQSNMVLRKGIRKIKQGMKRYNNQLTVLRNDLRYCKRKAADQHKMMTEMQKLMAEQQKQTVEMAARLNENDKKHEEMSMKISALLQESNKCKTELQFWRSKGHAPADDGGLADGGLEAAEFADADADVAADVAAVADAAEAVVAIDVAGDKATAAAGAPAADAASVDAAAQSAAVIDDGAPETATTEEQVQIEMQMPAEAAETSGQRTLLLAVGSSSGASEPTVAQQQQQQQQHQLATVMRSPSVRSTGNGSATSTNSTTSTTSTSTAGKRRADAAFGPPSDGASVGESLISGVSGGGGGGGVVVAAEMNATASATSSDIMKKARRVQSKARGQQPLSINGSFGSSCSSCSSSSSGGGGSGSISCATDGTGITTSTSSAANAVDGGCSHNQSSSNHSGHTGGVGGGGGKFTRSK